WAWSILASLFLCPRSSFPPLWLRPVRGSFLGVRGKRVVCWSTKDRGSPRTLRRKLPFRTVRLAKALWGAQLFKHYWHLIRVIATHSVCGVIP
ncbi:hypothetical protein H4582DRAFT_2021676, partial [Lactarius indigo]